MALQSLLEFEGFVSQRGYYRLSELHWSCKEPQTVRLFLDAYASQEAYLDGKASIKTLPYLVEIDPTHPEDAKVQILIAIRHLGYLEAKNIPELEGALDV